MRQISVVGLVIAAMLSVAGVARAASVVVTAEQTGAGSDQWGVSFTSDTALSILNVVFDGVGSFLISDSAGAGNAKQASPDLFDLGGSLFVGFTSGLDFDNLQQGLGTASSLRLGTAVGNLTAMLHGSAVGGAVGNACTSLPCTPAGSPPNTRGLNESEVSFVLIPFQVVPEPSMLVLIGAGLAGLAFVRRQRS